MKAGETGELQKIKIITLSATPKKLIFLPSVRSKYLSKSIGIKEIFREV
jgi:hypothetical protein